MRWLLQLYPAPWRERYGEEFGAVLARQRTSLGLVFDVLGGAVDAHLHPQIQPPKSKTIDGDDTMTLAMFERCAAGGPKLSPRDRRIASRSTILSALLMAVLYLALTRIYRGALPVEALGYASAPFLGLIYDGVFAEKAQAHPSPRPRRGILSHVPVHAGGVRAWPQTVIRARALLPALAAARRNPRGLERLRAIPA
jgi:hypothetical protein